MKIHCLDTEQGEKAQNPVGPMYFCRITMDNDENKISTASTRYYHACIPSAGHQRKVVWECKCLSDSPFFFVALCFILPRCMADMPCNMPYSTNDCAAKTLQLVLCFIQQLSAERLKIYKGS